MKAVIQRVSNARVLVDDKTISEIGNGLMILLGIKKGDKKEQVESLAEKCANLRIFEDQNEKFNLSLKDVDGEVLVVSQFTLLADTSRGRRPSFVNAEEPAKAKELYEYFVSTLSSMGIRTKGGVFGERMLVALENRGPVTIVMEQ
jgi:D-tyrosyl-tRNA(Tyr) deacylase